LKLGGLLLISPINSFFQHFSFAQPWWLLLLLAIPLVLFLRGKLGTPHTITFSSLSILGTLGTKPRNYAGAFSFTAIALCILCSALSLARPVMKTDFSEKTASGVDIMMAMDISLSMKTPDFTGGALRMDASRDTVREFIKARPNDRIGIVSFAGRPYLEAAVTLDHLFLLKKLETIKPRNDLDEGTAIGSAINLSGDKLLKYEDTKSRIIVLITDGSSNTGVEPLLAAKAARVLGIKIHTVAIGSENGRVPSNIQRYPDKEFDTETLKEIAKITSGQYYRAQTTSDLNDALDSIDRLETTDRQQKVISHTTDYHFWLTGAALSFALCYILIHSLASPPAPE